MVKLGKVKHVRGTKYECTLDLGTQPLDDVMQEHIEDLVEKRLRHLRKFKDCGRIALSLDYNPTKTIVYIYAIPV